MYEDLRTAMDWPRRLPSIAREFGKDIRGRQRLALFGPRYLTLLFTPQARLLDEELRHFGQRHRDKLPKQWQTHWPGRDQERLYLLLESLHHQDSMLRAESRAENSKAGVFHWHAGPIEVDLILPNRFMKLHIDPRMADYASLESLAIFRIGSSSEEPILGDLSFAEAIHSTQDAVTKVREALEIKPHNSLSKTTEEPPPRAPSQATLPARRGSWIKA